MQSRILTRSNILARVRTAAMLFLVVFLTSGLVGNMEGTSLGSELFLDFGHELNLCIRDSSRT
jgi:hypothetical protein